MVFNTQSLHDGFYNVTVDTFGSLFDTKLRSSIVELVMHLYVLVEMMTQVVFNLRYHLLVLHQKHTLFMSQDLVQIQVSIP